MQAGELTFALQAGALSVKIPAAVRGSHSDRLHWALGQPVPDEIKERRRDDGSVEVAYIVREKQPWCVYVRIDTTADAAGRVVDAAVRPVSGNGPLIRRQIRSKLESLPSELLDLITGELDASGVLALSATNVGLRSRLGVPRICAAVASSVYHLDDVSRVLANLFRDARVCDLRGDWMSLSAFGSLAQSRLTVHEKGHLLTLIALRVPLLEDDLDGYEDVGPAEQKALARFMVLDANDRLGGSGGDLSALRDGRIFGNVRDAIYAGVPVSDAIRTFGKAGYSDQELQQFAFPAAEVLIRTGSTWKEAAIVQGIDMNHVDCDVLKATASISIIAAAVRGLESIEEVRRLAHAHAIDDPDRLNDIENHWVDHKDDAMTIQILAGGHPHGVVQRLPVSDDEDPEEVPRFEGQDLTEAECLRVLHRAPRLIEAGHSAEQVISSLGIILPVSCHLTRRMHAGAVPAWLDVAKSQSAADDMDA